MIAKLDFVNKEIEQIPQVRNFHWLSHTSEGINALWANLRQSRRLIFQEPEILAFALLQWCCVGLGYYLWVQILAVFPPERFSRPPDLLISIWSLLIVGLVAMPLGILTGAMGVTHFLRFQGQVSTFARCLRIATNRYWQLWVFFWIDGWITVTQIVKRLPKKGERTISTEKILSEILYFAWKATTLGILPSVLNGRDLVSAAKESIALIKHRTMEVLLLRTGYSALSWVVGIAGYLFGVWLIAVGWFPKEIHRLHTLDLYLFYQYAGFPILLAAATVMLFLRPIFVLASFELYSSFVKLEKIKVDIPVKESTIVSIIFGLIAIALCLLAIVLYLANTSE